MLLVVWLFQEVTGSRVTNPMEVLGINWVPDLIFKKAVDTREQKLRDRLFEGL